MSNIHFGVIGAGNMGSFHVGYLDELADASLAAVCDADPKKLEQAAQLAQENRAKRGQVKCDVPKFSSYQELLDSGTCDAIIIATPHYQHPEIAIAAFEKGLHVLCEKPLAVGVKEARRVIDVHRKHPELKFALMFNQRTNSMYQKVRSLIAEGELGEVSRVSWIVTDWFRTWAYYASGGWRATWAGEGGGVLINQCPHNLDLIQWITGMMPSRVTAVASIAKTHPIEVEDEVSAIFEYPNGAIGHFVTTTGEAPGTNRLEICGDRGRIIAEGGKLSFSRTRKSVREVREKSKDMFVSMETWPIDVPHATGAPEGHRAVTENFVRGILSNETLIAPGEEGVKGLEIGNAMLMAGLTRRPVELPMDGDAYEQFLKDLTKQYGGKKTLQTQAAKADNMASSFQR